MSYQVLYTIPSAAAEPVAAGCVCSADTPLPLLQELRENTRMRKTDIGGPVFLYRTLEAGEKMYHIMTCINNTAAGTLVHHLAFTEAETAILRREEARPTPAGIMAALLRERFWPLAELPPEPPRPFIEAEALPDPSVQATWKSLTGHKSTAQRLNESPYDARCALLLPRGSATAEVLHLLHESDWLSSTCGWGVSFCTAADAEDVNTLMRRIACAEGGATARAAQRAGLPCFPIRKEKERLTPTRTYRPEYVYTEEADERFYPVARKLNRRRRQQAAWVLLPTALVTATLMLIGRSYLPAPQQPRPTVSPAPAAVTQAEEPQPAAVPEPAAAPQHAEEPQVTAVPAVLMPGDTLPQELFRDMAQGAIPLTQGELRVGRMGEQEGISRSLTEEQPALLAQDSAGFSIRCETGGEAPLTVSVALADGKVGNVTLGGAPAAVDFILPATGQRLIILPPTAVSDSGAAEFKPLPASWPPNRYIPCDKLLELTPGSAHYPYGRLQLGKGIPPLSQLLRHARLTYTLALPDLGTAPVIPDPLNELPASYRYRWKVKNGTALLTVIRDLAPAILRQAETRLNTYCAGTAGAGDNFFSLATLYGIAARLESAELTAADRSAAEADYAKLFTDAAFCRLVKEEILSPADHALCLSAEEASADTPEAHRRRQETAALLTPANCFKIREAVAQQVQPTLRSAYEAAAQALPPAPHPLLQLHHVSLTEDGRLQWQFRLYPAP